MGVWLMMRFAGKCVLIDKGYALHSTADYSRGERNFSGLNVYSKIAFHTNLPTYLGT